MAAREDVIDAFPFVGEMDPRPQARLFAAIVSKRLENGEVLAREGSECGYLPFILSGTLRVYKVGEQGKELTLYRIDRGESCILTATCILTKGEFPATAQAEGRTEVLLVPATLFRSFIDEFPPWRRYLFDLYSKRLEVVISVVEEVAFRHVDARIAAFLLDAEKTSVVQATHQRIASEVGTSREVVTRILKDFESEGLISASRGMVAVVDRPALTRRAGI